MSWISELDKNMSECEKKNIVDTFCFFFLRDYYFGFIYLFFFVGSEFKTLSLKYLLHILHSEYLDWRFSLMKYCIQNEQTDFASSVVCSIPFILQMKQFSPGTVFSDILQPTLAIGKTHVPVQHSLASIVGDLTCVLAGSCVCLRLEN
jgi:hypothetical protein